MDVPEGHLVVGSVVLEADVAVLQAAGRVGVGEVVDLRSVEEDLQTFALDLDLVAVPLARGPQDAVAGLDVRGLERVDGAGGAVGGVGRVDLDLVPVVDGRPRVVGLREAHEDTGVVIAGHLPVELQRVRRQLLRLVGEQAHAALGVQGAVLDGELPRTRLLPALQRLSVEDRPVIGVGLAVGLDLTGGVAQSAQDVAAEGRFGVGLLGVAESGVEGAAALVGLAPGDRVVALHVPAGVGGLVQGGENLGLVPGVGAVVVPLVGALPLVVEVGGGGVVVVLHADGGGLDLRVGVEVGADEAAVELPVVLGVGGRVDADVTAAGGHVVLERLLLFGVEDVAGGGEEGDGVVAGQVAGGELGGGLGGVDRDAGVLADLLQGLDARGDRVVAEAGGLGEDQDALGGPVDRGVGEFEVVDVVEGAVAALEDEEEFGLLLGGAPQRDVDVLEGVPAAGHRDGPGAEDLAGGRSGAHFEEAAGAGRGDPGGELAGVAEDIGLEGDPVVVVDVADRLAAVGAGLARGGDAGGGVIVLGLAVPGLEPGGVLAGQLGLAATAVVGVGGRDAAVDVGVGVVAAFHGGLDGAFTAVFGGDVVAVAVVAQRELDLDLGAVDGPVLRVADVHLERHGVAELEELPVLGEHQFHGRGGVADGDVDAGGAGAAGRVLRGDGGGVGAVLLVRVGGVGGRRGAAVTEVPCVGQRVAVAVRRAGRGELHLQRRGARGLVRRRLRDGRAASGGVLDPVKRGVLVAAEPGEAVVEDVQRPVRAERHVHDLGAGPRHVVDGLDGAVGVLLDALDPLAAELAGEEVAVVRLGELDRGVEVRVVAVDGAAHRGLGSGAELGDRAAVVGDPRGLGRRQVDETGVVRGLVLRGGAVEGGTGGLGGEVVVDVRLVGADAEGPAEVGGLRHPGELDLAGGAALGVGGARVGAVVTDVQVAGGLVHGEAEGVAEAHRVDLGAGLVRARREEVALGDGVRAVLGDLDAEDLAAQVVGVARGAAGVERRVAVGAFVDRGEAVGGERVGVVAGGEVEVAVGVEVDVTADVAAGAARGGDVQHLLLAGVVEGAVLVEDEAGEPVDAVELGEVGGGPGLRRVAGGGVERGRVEEVDGPVLGEVGVDADALEALLVVRVHGERAGDPGVAGAVGDAQLAVA